MTTENYQTRIVTQDQLSRGYETFANGLIMNHAYKIIHKITEGPYAGCYLVEEPQPPKGADE